MDLQLTGKVALVTGGAGRLGRAICAAFAAEGARVAVTDKDGQRAETVARELTAADTKAFAIAADVSVQQDVGRMVAAVESTLGPIDVLVNCHGVFVPTDIAVLDMDVADWDRYFAVNTRGTMLMCQAVGRRMVSRSAPGAIVNISSGAATSARLGGAGYGGSKAAIDLLTHSFAIEMGPHGVRVNAVAPGLVIDQVLRRGESHASEYVMASLHGIPMQRTGHPSDIAKAVVFLASPLNDWLTGVIMPVDGGSHCGRTHMPAPRDVR